MQDGSTTVPSSSRNAVKRYGKRLRACEACHALKIRCELGSTDLPPPCKRCMRLNKECHFTAPRPPKTADPRVAELEAQVAALTAQLHKQSLAGPTETKNDYDKCGVVQVPLKNAPEIKTENDFDITRRLLDEQERSCTVDYSSVTAIIDSLVDLNLGERIFHHFLECYVPFFPVVAFHMTTNAQEVRTTKPILFLAILSCCSSGLVTRGLQVALTKESTAVIARYVVIEGQKTIELVQALIISSLWFRTPDHHSKVNIGQLMTMAVTMAEDLGLDGRQRLSNTDDERLGLRPKCETQSLDAQRAWCACFILSARYSFNIPVQLRQELIKFNSASLIMRRADSLRWSEYLEKCVANLEAHSDASPFDRLLSQYVQAERLCAEAGEMLELRDHASKAAITDPVVVYGMKTLEEKVQGWSKTILATSDYDGVRFWLHATRMYIHEPALHVNHNIQEFEAPFTQASLLTTSIGNGSPLTSFHVVSLQRVIASAHQALDTFLSFPFPTLIILPPLLYASRVVYALTLLLKLYFCVMIPNSEVAKLFQKEDLKFEHYLQSIHVLATRLAIFDEHATQSRILLCTVKFREWYNEQNGTMSSTNEDQYINGKEDTESFLIDPPSGNPLLDQQQRSADTMNRTGDNLIIPMNSESWPDYTSPQNFIPDDMQIDFNSFNMFQPSNLFDEFLLSEDLTFP